MAQIALAWVMNKSPVSAPIVGTTSMQNLKELIGKHWSTSTKKVVSPSMNRNVSADAINIKLIKDEIKYLEEPYQPVPVVGIAVRKSDDDD